jgi:hypothetical protein
MEPIPIPVEKDDRKTPARERVEPSLPEPLLTHDEAYAFIDMDGDAGTGYSDGLPLGAELMVRVTGSGGAVRSASLLTFDSDGGAWVEGPDVPAACDIHRLECDALIEGGLPKGAVTFFMMTDWSGAMDGVISTGERWWEPGGEGEPEDTGADTPPDENDGAPLPVPEFGHLALPAAAALIFVLFAGGRARGGRGSRKRGWSL